MKLTMASEDGVELSEVRPSVNSDGMTEVALTPSFHKHGEGSSLSWKNVHYEISTGLPWKKKERTILQSVTGSVEAGQVLAIMGPSGCGKTSLLDLLSGRNDAHFDGDILFNGSVPDRSELKVESAYVMQDDALQSVMTVKENLWFSANLRLPSSMSRKKKNAKIDGIIDDLGLRSCAGTTVGGPDLRGISGGQRRRLSLGMELVTDPSLVFLDEPTTGLDSKASYKIVEWLVNYARREKKIFLVTIHSPSSDILFLFDKILLLSQGHQVYFGPVVGAVPFFGEVGLPIPDETNPADFFLETINIDFEENRAAALDNIREISEKHLSTNYMISLAESIDDSKLEAKKRSGEKKCKVNPVKKLLHSEYNTTGFEQWFYLVMRFAIKYFRDPNVFTARLVLSIAIALLFGSMYAQLGFAMESLNSRTAIIFFQAAFIIWFALASIPAFIQDREIFIRERFNGYYSVLPYALASITVGSLAVAIGAVVYVCIIYFLIGLAMNPEAFFYFLFMVTQGLIVSEGFMFFVSTFAPDFVIAIAIVSATYGGYSVVSGFLIKAKNIPGWWIWLYWSNFVQYLFTGMFVNEFQYESFECFGVNSTYFQNSSALPNPNCSCVYPDLNNDCIIQGSEVIDFYGFSYVNKWAYFGVVWGWAILFWILYYCGLRFVNKK